jgi:hypothetical protein
MGLYHSGAKWHIAREPHFASVCRGSSFLSLCIGMSLGLLLILIVLYDYQRLGKSMLGFSPHFEMAEKTREIVQFLGNDLRLSGYLGPRTRDPSCPIYRQLNPQNHAWLRQDRAVFGCASIERCSVLLGAGAMARLKAHSPIIIIYNIPKAIQRLSQAMDGPSGVMRLEHQTTVRVGSVVLVSDGLASDFFIASAVQGHTLFHEQTPYTNQSPSLSKAYPKGSEVIELQTVAYYLGLPSRSSKDRKTFSLYRDDQCHEVEEITEGIVGMKLEYRVLEPAKGLRFATADQLLEKDWHWVSGVRLHIDFYQRPSWRYDFAIRNGPRAHRDFDSDKPE